MKISTAEKDRRYREAHPEKFREKTLRQSRRQYVRDRSAVFDHYGWSCVCCGSTDRPSIDHVNGDGHLHREELFGDPNGGGPGIWRWLTKNGFPDGFQTLCMPCNRSKARGAACRINHETVLPR